MSDPIVLWHLRISHFSEKIRWTLDHKRIPHRRRAVLPGAHPLVARALGGGGFTLPVLELDGERISDSTAIIAALERRFPEAPLYPAAGADRERALRIEDDFDTIVAPAVRRLYFHHQIRDREHGPAAISGPGGEPHAKVLRAAWPTVGPFVRVLYGVGDDGSASAEREIREQLDALEARIGPSGYLVGDSFTIADLAAAALLGPMVRPPGYPLSDAPIPPTLVALRDELVAHPAAQWARETYVKHRGAPV